MFKNAVVALALLASQAWAITFTVAPTTVVAGQTYNLAWTGATGTGPVTILLRKGDPFNLQTVGTITDAGTGGVYSWTAPASFAPGADYALQITQGTDTNYFGPFSYTGGAAAVSSAVAMSSAAVVASSAASAASAGSASAYASVSAPASSYPTLHPSGYKNGTVSSTTLKPTSNSTSTKAPSASATLVSANSAAVIGSPLALVFSAVVAMLYFQ